MHRFLNEAQINNIDSCARCMHACDCSGSNSNGWSGEEGWICDLHDAHGQGGPAFRIARLLEQPLVGDHIVRPLRVHIQRVPAQANACVPSGERKKRSPGGGGGGGGPEKRSDRAADRAGRRWKWAQSASSKAGETAAEERRRASTSLYTSRRRPCLSVRRPPAPASDCRRCGDAGGGLSTAMDLPKRTAAGGRAAYRVDRKAAGTGTRRPCCYDCPCMGGGGAHVKRRAIDKGESFIATGRRGSGRRSDSETDAWRPNSQRTLLVN